MNSRQAICRFLEGVSERACVPGVQYVVVDSNGLVFEYTGGWANIKDQVRMTPATPLMGYSMTKTFTAAAILQLVDRGKLRLDDSVNTHLDRNPYGTSVTIRHLLAHTGGIPNPIPLRWVHPADVAWDRTDEKAALRSILLDNAEAGSRPGEKYRYSNIGYWLLGEIIEKAGGRPYMAYMRENVFKPLGIENGEMDFALPPGERQAKGYLARWSFMNLVKDFFIDRQIIGNYEDGGWLHIRSHYVNGPAFGGLIGTARAFGKFLQDQLRSSSVLFSGKAREAFFEQQKLNSGETIPMTLGWHMGRLDAFRYYFKEGGGGGFHCEMRIYPEHGIGTVIMANETSAKVVDYMEALDKAFIKDHTRYSHKGEPGDGRGPQTVVRQ